MRQGSVSSGIFFNCYCNRLFKRLRDLGTGCTVGQMGGPGEFCGVFVYCDDIFLLSASRSGLQSMMTTCQNFAADNNLQFSTNVIPKKSKSKCIIFCKNPAFRENVSPIMLDGNPLPWVTSVTHLGHVFDCDNNMYSDTRLKRGRFIGKINSLQQEFHFVSPHVKIDWYDKYACSFYGSNLYNLFCHETEKIYGAFNVSVRQAYQLPFNAHRYLIQPLLSRPHIKTQLCSRFVKFVQNNDNCSKPVIRLLSSLCKNDNRTTYCKNLVNIALECNSNMSNLSSIDVKNNMSYFPVPVDQEWRVDLLLSLLNIKSNLFNIDNFDSVELDDILQYVCSSRSVLYSFLTVRLHIIHYNLGNFNRSSLTQSLL